MSSITPKTTGLHHREWHIVPDTAAPYRFTLETETGNEVCTLVFPEADITAGMYRESMTGGRAERSMIFGIVSEVPDRVK